MSETIKETITTYALAKSEKRGKRIKTDKPRWYGIDFEDKGWIVTTAMDISTPRNYLVADTEEELKKLMGDNWPEVRSNHEAGV